MATPVEEPHRVRQRLHRLGRLPVSGWRGPLRGGKAEGCSGELGGVPLADGSIEFAKVFSRFEELSEESPEEVAPANARGVSLGDGGLVGLSRQHRSRSLPGHIVPHLSEARSSSRSLRGQRGAAHSGHQRRRSPCACGESLRERDFNEVRLLPRDRRPGRRHLSTVGQVPVPACREHDGQVRRREGGRSSLEPVGARLPGRLALREPRARPGGHGDSLPGAPRRGLSRFPSPATHSGRDHATGFWGIRLVDEDLQQARPDPKFGKCFGSYRRCLLWRHQGELRKVCPVWHFPGAARGEEAKQKKIRFLNLFGGKGRGAEFVARRGGVSCLIDLSDNVANNLDNAVAWRDAERLALTATVTGADLPCITWNRIRRAPLRSRMPHRLRDRSGLGLWGLPGLNGEDALFTRLANIQVRRVCRMVKKLIRQDKHAYLENPLSSILWAAIFLLLRREIEKGLVVFLDTDMCCYGTPWQKATRVMIWGPARHRIQLKRCVRTNNLCSTSGRPHEQLVGQINGVWKTSLGQVYPMAFITSLLSQMLGLPS